MALDEHTLNQTADRMLADYDAVTPGTMFAEGFRVDVQDAWRIQTAVTNLREARGETVAGYKVGAVAPGNQQMMGLPHPAWGRLWASEVHQDGAELRKADYANISIEAEFGVILSHDLTPGMSISRIAASVASVHPVLELHNLALRGGRPHGAELIANNAINCGVVIGGAVTDIHAARKTDLKLVYDGSVVDGWEGLNWPDGLLAAVDWLTGALSDNGLSLKAGDLILTGAWGPPIPVNDHTRVEATSAAFGDVFATFV
jgi:2-keto-4-pentenoate hydratase